MSQKANDSQAVVAALDYAAYSARMGSESAALWAAKFGARAKGDDLLGRLETETRPEACMRILAAEVLRLRSLTYASAIAATVQSQPLSPEVEKALDDLLACSAKVPFKPFPSAYRRGEGRGQRLPPT